MTGMKLATRGLLLATAASISNAGFELSGKRALASGQFLTNVFWIRASVALAFSSLMLVILLVDHSSLWLFRVGFAGLALWGLLPSLLLSTFLVSVSNLLYYRALQVAPLSQTIPMFAFTPVFLVGTKYLFFRTLPSGGVVLGVGLVVLGTVLLHWNTSGGPIGAALHTFLHSAGSQLMLASCLLLAVTNHLDRFLVMQMDAISYSWSYSVLCALFACGFALCGKRRGRALDAAQPRWIALAAGVDATMLLLQMASLKYIDVVVAIAIKRSGMILSVFGGWLIYHERMGRQRLAAATVVLAGALMMYFDFPPVVRLAICAGALLVTAYVAGARSARLADPVGPQD